MLIFLLFNPVSATAFQRFPVLDRHFSNGYRLLTGWALAIAFQFAAWKLSRTYRFSVVEISIFRTGLALTFLWFALILMTWWAFD